MIYWDHKFSCFSEGKELNSLVFSDFYYHLQGELEGRKINSGPFKELCQYLVESRVLQAYHKYDIDPFVAAKDVWLFDLVHVQADLGLDLWNYSKWKTSKSIVERMLQYMLNANSLVLLTNAKLSAMKALISVLTIFENDVSSLNSVSLLLHFQSFRELQLLYLVRLV